MRSNVAASVVNAEKNRSRRTRWCKPSTRDFDMRKKIDRLAIKGFKTIRNLSNFPLGDINVVVGVNCAPAFECLDERFGIICG